MYGFDHGRDFGPADWKRKGGLAKDETRDRKRAAGQWWLRYGAPGEVRAERDGAQGRKTRNDKCERGGERKRHVLESQSKGWGSWLLAWSVRERLCMHAALRSIVGRALLEVGYRSLTCDVLGAAVTAGDQQDREDRLGDRLQHPHRAPATLRITPGASSPCAPSPAPPHAAGRCNARDSWQHARGQACRVKA